MRANCASDFAESEVSMIRKLFLAAAFAALYVPLSATCQVPASAPAGSTGQCKDGTYSNAAHKSGACTGHKGVQSWFSADSPAPAAKASATPAPAAPAAAAKPAPTPTPAPQPAPTSVARNAPAPQQAPAAGGGPGMVWVNTASKVYHCPGTAYYGKTKAGKYVSEDAAKAEGDHADHGKLCSK